MTSIYDREEDEGRMSEDLRREMAVWRLHSFTMMSLSSYKRVDGAKLRTTTSPCKYEEENGEGSMAHT
jgi:hypothetical protein